ncbi:MAG: RNA polymerase sigma factor RpoD/SigA [Fibrobacteria bacterium]|nr:RNA polymerase sigma factor RpoD/SigA [Fibrobacteria bacterium]
MVTINDDFNLYHKYIREVKRYSLLTKKEEEVIISQVKTGNKKAFNRLITANLKFVIKIAWMYRGQGLTISDLINEGNIGLIQAAKRYDSSKQVRFTSYAVWWIRQAILQAVYEKSRIVRISAAKEMELRRLKKQGIIRKFQMEGKNMFDSKNHGKEAGVTGDRVEKIIQADIPHVSLDAPFGPDSKETMLENMSSSSYDDPDELVETGSLSNLISKHIKILKPIEKKVITFYFGLNSNKIMNLREIGDIFGLSKERIRQIKSEALNKLKNLELEQAYAF